MPIMTYLALWLTQAQFFLGAGFMLLFVALELGLVWVLFYLRCKALFTRSQAWLEAYRLWVRVFALSAALAFASGVALMVQFAMLWPEIISTIGNITGPQVALVVATVYIIKSGFLGVMLFGGRRFPGSMHTMVVGLVAITVSVSSFSMLSLLSWPQTPTGVVTVNQLKVVSVSNVLFNPAAVAYMPLLVSLAAIGTGFLLISMVSAQSLRNPIGLSHGKVSGISLTLMLIGFLLFIVGTASSVHMATLHLPAKAAALAGYWQSGASPDLALFAWPDQPNGKNLFAYVVPNLAQYILTPDTLGGWRGLDQFSGMQPPVALVFWSFRLLLILVVFLIIISLVTWLMLHKRQYHLALLPYKWRKFLTTLGFSGVALILLALVNIQFGSWPYAVYGLLTFSELAVGHGVASLMVTNVLYLGCYAILFSGFVLLLRHISRYGVVPVRRLRGTP